MKLTPLDIHHKEFRHSLRGYDEKEVDDFLDDVADELERLFKENIDLSERLEAATQKLNEFELQRQTINNTLMAAQRSAEDIVSKANAESETILKDAEVKAKEIIHNALTKKQSVQNELVRIKQAEEEFRAKFKAMLESHLRQLSEIGLPADVDVMIGETDEGIVGAVEVREPAPAAAPSASAPPAASAPEAAQPTQVMPAAQPPDSGFVQSVTLGEVDAPDIEAEPPVLSDPPEFAVGSISELGEREDDVDIEEID